MVTCGIVYTSKASDMLPCMSLALSLSLSRSLSLGFRPVTLVSGDADNDELLGRWTSDMLACILKVQHYPTHDM